MKVFDYKCRDCGKKFEAYVASADEVVNCIICNAQCEKQLGGRPAKSPGRGGDDHEYESSYREQYLVPLTMECASDEPGHDHFGVGAVVEVERQPQKAKVKA